jgi:hypothetical protein
MGERVVRGQLRAAVRFFARFLLALILIPGSLIPAAISADQDRAIAPDKAPDPKSFVGRWTASFKGEVFAILILKEEGGELGGTLNNFDLVVDKNGDLLDGTHKNVGEAKLLNPHFKSGALVFVVMQKDQYYPSTQFGFVPTSAREGLLTPSSDNPPYASSNSSVKPIPMVRDPLVVTNVAHR